MEFYYLDNNFAGLEQALSNGDCEVLAVMTTTAVVHLLVNI